MITASVNQNESVYLAPMEQPNFCKLRLNVLSWRKSGYLENAFVYATPKLLKERGRMFLLFSHKPLVAQEYMHVLKFMV